MFYKYRCSVLTSKENLDALLNWCAENFGETMEYKILVKNIERLTQRDEIPCWTYFLQSCAPQEGKCEMMFSDKEDYTAFKLRWV